MGEKPDYVALYKQEQHQRMLAEHMLSEYRQALANAQFALAQANALNKLASPAPSRG